MRYCSHITLLLVLIFWGSSALAQQRTATDTIPLPSVMYNGELIPAITLPFTEVVDRLPRRLVKEHARWTRLRNAVYVTYPYALTAAALLKDVNSKLASLPDKRARKEFLASKEKEMKEKFGNKLEDLSVYQGKVLMKLINRQTGENCYDIIKELKGGFNARVWQTVAFFVGGDLKTQYDIQEDRDIEMIVQEIEVYHSLKAYN